MCGLEDVRKVFDYNPETGVLARKNGKKCGWVTDNGYLAVSVKNKKYLVHRVVWLYHYGEWPKNDIDHINGDKQDNRISNLRDVPDVINLHNVPRANRDNKTTGVRGVHLHRQTGKYRAQITVAGRIKDLGMFNTVEEAEKAYLSNKP